jgi:hypothetical protein
MAAISVLERTLQTKMKAATLLDGDKFALLVPTNLVKSVSAELGDMTNPAPTDEILPRGAIFMRGIRLSQVLPVYGELIGRKFLRGKPLPESLISFHAQTALSKAEVKYAFDILFRWQGLKAVFVGADSFRMISTNGR